MNLRTGRAWTELPRVTPAGQDWRRALDGTRLGPRLPEFARSDAEGRFEFDDLPAGRHRVSAVTIPYRAGLAEVQVEPGSYSVVPAGPDLIATPQDVVLEAGATRALRFEVGIGRSRSLVCNGDGVDKPPRGAILHVVVRRGGDEIVRTDLPADQWSLRGFYSWSLDRVFAFGRYEVEASTDAGRTYRASFEVRENLDDPTRVEVPLVGR